MAEHAGKVLFRRYMSIWENGDLDRLADIIGPGYVGHPTGGDRDLEGLRDRILAFRAAYPDVRFTVEDQLAEGDRVASRMTARATRAADGRPVVLTGHNICRIAGGRIVEEWMAWEAMPTSDRPGAV